MSKVILKHKPDKIEATPDIKKEIIIDAKII
jgi:hypothetical protein